MSQAPSLKSLSQHAASLRLASGATATAPFLGRGWAFPPSFTAGGRDVAMVVGADDVLQSLQILMATLPGERVLQEDFGCDLLAAQFAEIDHGLLNTLKRQIEDAVRLHEPRVDLHEVTLQQRTDDVDVLMVSISYTLRSTNSRFNMVFPFYLRESSRPGPSLGI